MEDTVDALQTLLMLDVNAVVRLVVVLKYTATRDVLAYNTIMTNGLS